MANPILFKDTAIAPTSLNGVNHVDIDFTGKRHVVGQFDPLTSKGTSPGCRLYVRVDEAEAAGGATIALLVPEAFLTSGGAFEVWLDPDATETPHIHALLTDANGTPIAGGAEDRILWWAERANPD